jgi:serine/threonine-protein kinase
MSYCLNPACSHPANPTHTEFCQSCSSKLLLRDRYQATRILGRGGFGTTFLAEDAVLPGRPSCVIKQLRPVVSAPHILEMARELFQREAMTLGKIGSHPQLPRLLDYFELDQEFYLIQEYVSGSTLQQEIKRSGPLNEEEAKTVVREVLVILDYLHSQEVIHRDIKPANLIRRSIDHKLVLIDFGAVKDQVSQAMAANPQEYSTLTAFAVGTPGYAPPEQMAMRPVYASDLYALGVTCLYLLIGKSPKDLTYDPATGELLWRNLVKISDHFREVLEKMLEASVRQRYQSAKEILRALELEPYLDSLSQGMSAQTTSATNRSSSRETVSPSARAAVAIRAQQARLDSTGSSNKASTRKGPEPRQGSHSAGIEQSFARKGPGPRRGTHPVGEQFSAGYSGALESKAKMSAAGLLSTYKKGRRDFTNQDLSGLDLGKANLPEAIFHQAKLRDTDLRGANLFNVNLGRASLAGAILRDTNLSKAYLSYADMAGADLRGADLREAYLNNANLRGANLCGANLKGATLTEDQLALARTNWSTILPNGRRGKLW